MSEETHRRFNLHALDQARTLGPDLEALFKNRAKSTLFSTVKVERISRVPSVATDGFVRIEPLPLPEFALQRCAFESPQVKNERGLDGLLQQMGMVRSALLDCLHDSFSRRILMAVETVGLHNPFPRTMGEGWMLLEDSVPDLLRYSDTRVGACPIRQLKVEDNGDSTFRSVINPDWDTAPFYDEVWVKQDWLTMSVSPVRWENDSMIQCDWRWHNVIKCIGKKADGSDQWVVDYSRGYFRGVFTNALKVDPAKVVRTRRQRIAHEGYISEDQP
jgi:hypothetical protein